MKKALSLLLSMTFILALLAGCAVSDVASGETPNPGPSEQAKNHAGTYKGTAPGYHGELGVTVTLNEAGKIVSVAVDEGHGETKNIGTVAINKIPDAIVATQSLKVDAVSGATVTGDAIIAAVAAALKSAGLNPADYSYTEVAAADAEEAFYTLNPDAMPAKAPITGTINLKDAKGREVTLDLPVSTYAISTMDLIDYIIPMLGKDAFHKLVGSGQSGSHSLQTYARLYTPIVGNYTEHVGQISDHNAPFDLEIILAMDPDVLIVNSAMGAHRYALEVEPQLTAAGIPIVLVNVPGKSFTTSAQSTLRLLGRIFEKERRAEEVASFLDEQFALIASRNLVDRADKPTVYYEKSGYSEVFGSTSTSKSGWGTVIAAAGGGNIADPLLLDSAAGKGSSNTLDPEYVIKSDPDYIILSGSGLGWMDNIPSATLSPPSFDIVNRTGWSTLRAVKNNNVYELAHAASRSIYGFHACLKLATVFYPEEFKGVDPDAVMAEFFDRFMLVDSDVTVWWYRLGEFK